MGLNIKIPVFVCSSSGLIRSPLYLSLYNIQGLVLNEPLNLSPNCYCIKIALRFFYMMTNLHHYLKIMIDLSNMHHQLRLSTLSLHTTTSCPIFTPLCHFFSGHLWTPTSRESQTSGTPYSRTYLCCVRWCRNMTSPSSNACRTLKVKSLFENLVFICYWFKRVKI